MPQFKRREGCGIMKVANYIHGQGIISFTIEEAHFVTLHCDDCQVLVQDICRLEDGNYKGTVLGLEPFDAKLPGVKEGDVVHFAEENVISAAK